MLKKYLDQYKKMPVQIKASFWFLICSFMQKGISVITTPIFTRLLPTADYGQYGVFNSWLDIVSIFVTLRLYYGVFVQGLVKYEDDRARYASSMQGLGLSLSLIWTIIYLLFHNFWNRLFGLTTVQMLAMMVMIWTSGVFRFWASEQRVQYKYRLLVVITLGVSILKPVLGIFLVINAEDKVTARILGLVIAEFIGYSGLFLIQMWRGKQFYSAKYWKHALMFNIPLIPHYLSQTVLNSADKIMIKDMIGASEAGIYALAYSISKLMTMLNTALNQTLNPWIYQKIKANKVDDIAGVAYPALIGVAFANLSLIAFAPEVVTIFAPKSYHDAIWVIPPVAMSVFFTFSYNLFASFEFYFEETKFIMTASVGGAILNILLNYYFIGIVGYYAAGYTTLFCYIVYAVSHYIFMLRVCDRHLNGKKVYDIKKLLGIATVFLMIGFAFLLTYNYPIMRFIIVLALLIVLIVKRKTIKEKAAQLLNIRKSRKKKVK